MPESELRLVRRCAEFIPKDNRTQLPRRLRGIYVLYRHRAARGAHSPRGWYDVLYVGMATAGRRGGLRGRLMSHARSKRKGRLWTHFSVFEVWDNIRDEEIRELEGLFRHIYRMDSAASGLNIQRGFKRLRRIRDNNLQNWQETQAHHRPRRRALKEPPVSRQV
jgi:hypothetical protein